MDKLLEAFSKNQNITQLSFSINGVVVEIPPNEIEKLTKYLKNMSNLSNVDSVNTLSKIAKNIPGLMRGGNMDNSIYDQMQLGGFINSDYSELPGNTDTLSFTDVRYF
jgi:hypothetical protein